MSMLAATGLCFSSLAFHANGLTQPGWDSPFVKSQSINVMSRVHTHRYHQGTAKQLPTPVVIPWRT